MLFMHVVQPPLINLKAGQYYTKRLTATEINLGNAVLNSSILYNILDAKVYLVKTELLIAKDKIKCKLTIRK